MAYATATADPDRFTVGYALPFLNQYTDYETIVGIASLVDDLGFDSMWFSDHVTGPTPMGAVNWYEVTVLMAHVAALQPRLALGTDVLVPALRNPVLSAKMLMTVDVVSSGKLIVGIGTGYVEEEYRALSAPFDERGPLTDECLEVWRAMWSPGNATFHGKYFALDDVPAEPKPVQQPHPPLWFGIASRAALRRTVEIGDGWHPIGLTVEQYAAVVDQLRAMCEDAGRPMPTLSVSGGFGTLTPDPVDGVRALLCGSVEQILDDIGRLRDLGVANIVVRVGTTPEGSVTELLDQIAAFGEGVLAACR